MKPKVILGAFFIAFLLGSPIKASDLNSNNEEPRRNPCSEIIIYQDPWEVVMGAVQKSRDEFSSLKKHLEIEQRLLYCPQRDLRQIVEFSYPYFYQLMYNGKPKPFYMLGTMHNQSIELLPQRVLHLLKDLFLDDRTVCLSEAGVAMNQKSPQKESSDGSITNNIKVMIELLLNVIPEFKYTGSKKNWLDDERFEVLRIHLEKKHPQQENPLELFSKLSPIAVYILIRGSEPDSWNYVMGMDGQITDFFRESHTLINLDTSKLELKADKEAYVGFFKQIKATEGLEESHVFNWLIEVCEENKKIAQNYKTPTHLPPREKLLGDFDSNSPLIWQFLNGDSFTEHSEDYSLVYRNRGWRERIRPAINNCITLDVPHFLFVGAAHFEGREGLLTLLKDKSIDFVRMDRRGQFGSKSPGL